MWCVGIAHHHRCANKFVCGKCGRVGWALPTIIVCMPCRRTGLRDGRLPLFSSVFLSGSSASLCPGGAARRDDKERQAVGRFARKSLP